MQQTCTERVYGLALLSGQGDPQGIVEEIKVWLYEQMVYAQPEYVLKNKTQNPLGFWDTNESPDLG